MFFISILKYIRGYVLVHLTGYAPERFLNMCGKRNILIWNLKAVEDGYLFYISVDAYKALKPVLKKTRTRARILEKHGLPFFMFRYRGRKMFVLGVALFIGMLFYTSRFVWNIEVNGNSYLSEETILEFLKEENADFGTKISQIEIKQRLIEICNNEGFTNYEQACDLISKTTHGCMRDAIMKLEQCADFDTNLALENVQQVLSSTSFDALIYLTWALYAKDESQQHQAGILWTIENLYNSGADLKNFIELYLEFLLDLTKYTVYRDLKLTSIPVYLEQTIINLTIQHY